MTPIVSVLLITYNHEKYISKAIESVLKQETNYDYELLIGDDCSVDNTAQIVREFKKKYPEKIKLVTATSNVGALRNEKRLIEAAKGKYLAFIEGDDFWTDNLKLEKQVDFLEANSDYGLVHSDVNHFYENTGKWEMAVNKTGKVSVPNGNIFEYLMKPTALFIKTATTCFRKELVLKYFDYDIAIRENWPLTDFPLWLDISKNSKVHYFDEVFATYQLLNKSASRNTSHQKKLEFHQAVFNIKQYYCIKYNCGEVVKKLLLEQYHRVMLRDAYNLINKSIARESYSYLIKNNHIVTFKEKIMILILYLKIILIRVCPRA